MYIVREDEENTHAERWQGANDLDHGRPGHHGDATMEKQAEARDASGYCGRRHWEMRDKVDSGFSRRKAAYLEQDT
ncbi:unnamed protein product, partial [Didymodactylos carnosus]